MVVSMRQLRFLAAFLLLTACATRPAPAPPSPTDERLDVRIEGYWRSETDKDMTVAIERVGERYVIRVKPQRDMERRFRADLVRFEGGDFVVVEARDPRSGVLHFPLLISAEGDRMVVHLPLTEAIEARLSEAGRPVGKEYCGKWGEREFCAPDLAASPRDVLALLQQGGASRYFEGGEAWRRIPRGEFAS
jgi:hypothetical protein